MDDLIEALTIFRKYGNPDSPTHCTHDRLTVTIDPAVVSAEDIARLDELDFHTDGDTENGFYSFRFGSA
jgi:hypothetical protein